MKFYEVCCDGYFEDEGNTGYFATLNEAKRVARDAANQAGCDVLVDQVEAATTKAGIVQLASGRDWCISRETVFTAKPRKRTGS
jgi:hypothetical protein